MGKAAASEKIHLSVPSLSAAEAKAKDNQRDRLFYQFRECG